MILEHVILREILCRAAERKITCSESAVLMKYAGTMLIITPHSASKVAGESTLTIHLGSDESKCDKHL